MPKIPGKVVQITSISGDDEAPPGLAVLTDQGRIFVTYDDRPAEQWVWTESNYTVEET